MSKFYATAVLLFLVLMSSQLFAETFNPCAGQWLGQAPLSPDKQYFYARYAEAAPALGLPVEDYTIPNTASDCDINNSGSVDNGDLSSLQSRVNNGVIGAQTGDLTGGAVADRSTWPVTWTELPPDGRISHTDVCKFILLTGIGATPTTQQSCATMGYFF